MTDFLSFKTFKRASKPNNALVAPPDYTLASEPDSAGPIFHEPVASLFERTAAIIAANPTWTKLETDAASKQLKFVAVTKFLRFKDDVDIAIVPIDGNRSSIAVYSRSRVGYSDLGTNAKRVQALLAALNIK